MTAEPQVLAPLKEVQPLEQLRSEIDQISSVALQQRIASQETKDAALEIGNDVKRLRKALDMRRKTITQPLQDLVKRVIAFADALDAPLDKAENHIRRQAVAYAEQIAAEQRRAAAALEAEKQRLKREEEVRLRNAAAMAETVEEQHGAQEQIRQEYQERRQDVRAQAAEIKAAGVRGTTEVWTFALEDGRKVPREYCEPDTRLIREAVARGIREIPGIKIYKETRVRLG